MLCQLAFFTFVLIGWVTRLALGSCCTFGVTFMRSCGRTSPPRPVDSRKWTSAARAEPQEQPEDGSHTYAEYVERRRGLVAAITDELDDHALQMEARSRQAVTHAAAVIQSSQAQEKACLDRLDRLHDRVASLQQARHTAAAALKEFQQSTAATRQQLENELQELQLKVDVARKELSAVRTTIAQQQQQQEEESNAARRRYEAAVEQQLQTLKATVEARFQRAVAALQAQVQERKAWADAQCALCEERVREATRRAEAAELSSSTRHASSEARTAAAAAATCSASTPVVEWQMRELEAEMEERVRSAGVHREATMTEQQTAKTTLKGLNCSVALKKDERSELHRVVQELSAVLNAAHSAEPRKGHVCTKKVRSTQKQSEAANGVFGTPPAEATASFSFSSESVSHQCCAAAPVAANASTRAELCKALPRPAPAALLERKDNPHTPAKSEGSVDVGRFSPSVHPYGNVDDALSPIREASAALSTSSPRRRGTSHGTRYPESTLVRDVSCSFDAFVAVSPMKKKTVQVTLEGCGAETATR